MNIYTTSISMFIHVHSLEASFPGAHTRACMCVSVYVCVRLKEISACVKSF